MVPFRSQPGALRVLRCLVASCGKLCAPVLGRDQTATRNCTCLCPPIRGNHRAMLDAHSISLRRLNDFFRSEKNTGVRLPVKNDDIKAVNIGYPNSRQGFLSAGDFAQHSKITAHTTSLLFSEETKL